MFWKKKKIIEVTSPEPVEPQYEIVEEDAFLKTYRVRVYTTLQEAPFEGIFKEDTFSSYYIEYIREVKLDPRYEIELSGMKENITHYLRGDTIKYIESEMIYRTPIKLRRKRRVDV